MLGPQEAFFGCMPQVLSGKALVGGSCFRNEGKKEVDNQAACE